MNNQRPKRGSRIVSWIAGSALKDGENSAGRPRRNRSSSLRSFIPSIRNGSKAENSFTSLPRSVSSGQPPEPFFYSKPLTREGEDEYSFVTTSEEGSLSSLSSSEIALWKLKRADADVSPIRVIPKRKFSRFFSVLTRKEARGTSPLLQTPTDGTLPGLAFEDSFVKCEMEDAEDSIMIEHPFSLPELTFSSSQKRSSDLSSLLPPPRAKRGPVSTLPRWSLLDKQAHTASTRTSIDPAKWVEISISAADLVRIYGRENVIIQNADEYPSSDLEKEDVGTDVHAQESFMEMDDEVSSLPSSLECKSVPHQALDVAGSSVVTESSFVGSMASFSKWPLPPQCEQFGMEKVVG